MGFIPPRPAGPNPGRMAAQRAAQQAARNAGAGAYLARRQTRRAGVPTGLPASAPMTIAGTVQPSALAEALRVTLGGFIMLLFFAVVDRFAAPPQLGSALLLYAASAVALMTGYRVVAGTGRLGAALLCGILLGLGMALLGLLTFLTFARGLPANALTLYLSRAEVGDIRTLLLLAGVSLAGGASAKLIQMLRDRQV